MRFWGEGRGGEGGGDGDGGVRQMDLLAQAPRKVSEKDPIHPSAVRLKPAVETTRLLQLYSAYHTYGSNYVR